MHNEHSGDVLLVFPGVYHMTETSGSNEAYPAVNFTSNYATQGILMALQGQAQATGFAATHRYFYALSAWH